MFSLTASRYLKTKLINYFCFLFKYIEELSVDDSFKKVIKQYTWHETESRSKIRISYEEPQKPISQPQIIVDATTIKTTSPSIGQSAGENAEQLPVYYYEHLCDATLRVSTYGLIDTEQIADILNIFIVGIPFVRCFETLSKCRFVINEGVSTSAISKVPIPGATNKLKYECNVGAMYIIQTEWSMELGDIGIIEDEFISFERTLI